MPNAVPRVNNFTGIVFYGLVAADNSTLGQGEVNGFSDLDFRGSDRLSCRAGVQFDSVRVLH
jgi:hypothetical protein